jgi:hypothetical protein
MANLLKQSLINLIRTGQIGVEKLYELADNGTITEEELDDILDILDMENI